MESKHATVHGRDWLAPSGRLRRPEVGLIIPAAWATMLPMATFLRFHPTCEQPHA